MTAGIGSPDRRSGSLLAPDLRPAGDAIILELDEIRKHYGGIYAVDGVSFKIVEHTVTSLIGPNGSGKSTLFNSIAGEVTLDSGRVMLDGVEVQKRSPDRIARLGIGRTFQSTQLFDQLTVFENLLAISQLPSRRQSIRRSLELLDFLDIAELRHSRAGELSYGQQKLLEIARALILSPRLLLLDEPFAGINPALQDRIVQHLLRKSVV